MVCSDASSASASLVALVARVQCRRSLSVGVWRPFSSFDTLDGGQDRFSASCLPLRPAAWRSSRSRPPRALRASWTFDAAEVLFGGKVVSSHGMVPGGVTPVVVVDDLFGIIDDLAAQEGVVIVEVHPDQLA